MRKDYSTGEDTAYTSEDITKRVAGEKVRYHRTSLEPKVEASQEELDDMCWGL